MVGQRIDDIESIHTRHANVEEQQLRACRFYEFDRLQGSCRLAYDLNVAVVAKQLAQLLPRQDFIVCHHCVNHQAPYLVRLSAGFAENCKGNEMATCTRLASSSPIVNEQPSP